MSFAIDNAEVFLYAVSEQYKESGNCRLEANVRTPAGSATYLGSTLAVDVLCRDSLRCFRMDSVRLSAGFGDDPAAGRGELPTEGLA